MPVLGGTPRHPVPGGEVRVSGRDHPPPVARGGSGRGGSHTVGHGAYIVAGDPIVYRKARANTGLAWAHRRAMNAAMTQTVEINAQQIAYRHHQGIGPAIVFLPGYMSDMAGGKASATYDWCAAQGRECLLLDYSGCGESSGDFADGTLSIWRDEVLGLINAKVSSDSVIIAGSSMGGWLMVLVGMALGSRLHALVGIAAAPDFTDWGYDEAQKSQLRDGETIFEESDYGYDPMPTHAKFWRDGENNRWLDREIPVTCPVRLLHGQEDADVPSDTSLKLAAALTSDDVQVTLVKGGDHRLSRDADIALLLHTYAAI